MSIKIDQEVCTGCGECVEVCAVEALVIENGKAVVDEDMCVECRACEEQCPTGAITFDD